MASGNSTGRIITTEQASIETCAVEIKALMIGRKQMTLSVFRQLPRRHIFDPGQGLRGKPWGTVNYFWDGCGYSRNDGQHLHVVWADEGRLFRACVGLLLCRGNRVKGDPDGLNWLDGNGADWDFDYGGHYIACKPETVKEEMGWWNGRYWELAALDQLFIAV